MNRCEANPPVEVNEKVRELLLAQPLNPFVRLKMTPIPKWGSIVDADKSAEREAARLKMCQI